MTDEHNQYARAVSHPDPTERAKSLAAFLDEEIEGAVERLGGEDSSDTTDYQKGRLDALRLVSGVVRQGLLHEGEEADP